MELIDAYVAEVGRHLPEKQRADIERETRSMIEDTLEDESSKQGRLADEDLLVEVLKRLGSPEKLAASYAPPRFLVGPALYPSYLLTLRLVLGIVLVLSAFGIMVAVASGSVFGGSTPLQSLGALGKGMSGLVNAGLQVVGIITIIFALIQRSAPGLKPASLPQDFDPRKLKVVPATESEPFKPVGLIIDIVMSGFALLIFNFYQQYVGIYYFDGNSWTIVPVMTAAFFAYVPFMSILWALEAALKGSVLGLGRWTTATKWLRIGLKVLTIAMLYVIISGPEIVALPAEAIINPGGAEFPMQFSYWINFSVRLSIGIALVVTTIEVAVTTIKLLLAKKTIPALG
jgi:hypothetical protein